MLFFSSRTQRIEPFLQVDFRRHKNPSCIRKVDVISPRGSAATFQVNTNQARGSKVDFEYWSRGLKVYARHPKGKTPRIRGLTPSKSSYELGPVSLIAVGPDVRASTSTAISTAKVQKEASIDAPVK